MNFTLFESKASKEQKRVERIRAFVASELLPETRAEILQIVKMFPYDTAKSDELLVEDYLMRSEDSFLNRVQLKNRVEQRIQAEKAKLDAAERQLKQAAVTEFVDKEARAYISHMIQNILSGSYNDSEGKQYPPELFKLAEAVRMRAFELVRTQKFS